MTETEQKIVRILSVTVPNTLCDMYTHLRGNVDNCEIDSPLLDLCDRGVVWRVGKQRCMRGDRCLSCGDGGTIAYVLAREMERPKHSLADTAAKPTRPLPDPPARLIDDDPRRPLCPICWFPGTRDGVLIERCRNEECHIGERVRTIDELYNQLRTVRAEASTYTPSSEVNAEAIGKLQG